MTRKVLDDEYHILQRLQAGDENAFARVYGHYYTEIFTQVLYLLHSRAMAEDVTQEIFLKLWENRTKIKDIRSFRSYLFISARNHTLNVLKKAARSEAGMGEIIRHFKPLGNITDEQVLSREYTAFIRKKLDELPPRAREIFLLCREQNKSYEEVAQELGITRDAVKSRMVYAMKTLSDAVKKEIGLLAIWLLLNLD